MISRSGVIIVFNPLWIAGNDDSAIIDASLPCMKGRELLRRNRLMFQRTLGFLPSFMKRAVLIGEDGWLDQIKIWRIHQR